MRFIFMRNVRRLVSGLVLGVVLGAPAMAQTKASVTYYGSSCNTSGGPTAAKCSQRNEGNGFAGGAFIKDSRWYLSFQPQSAMSVSALALRTQVETTGPVTVPIYLFGADPVTGAPDPNQLLSRGSIVVRKKLDWYLGWLCPAVPVAAGQQTYLTFENPKPGILKSEASTGRTVTHYRQLLPGGPISGPVNDTNWMFRVRCGTECPSLNALTPPRFGNGGQFVIEVRDASPTALALTGFGTSNTTFNGVPLPISLESFGNPNCTLQINAVPGNGHGIDPVGKSRIVVPIRDKGLMGTKFYVQTIIVNPITLQFESTQGIEAVIGF
jgi:hypothetical protein